MFWNFWWYSQLFRHEKLENLWSYSWNSIIKKLKPEVFGSWAIGGIHETRFWPPPRSSFDRGALQAFHRGLRSCAAAAKKAFHETTYHMVQKPKPHGFNLFDFRVSWNHQRFRVFMPKNFQTSQWNKVTKKKRGFYLKLTAAAKLCAISFNFFPDLIWRFHNFMLVLISWNRQPVSFRDGTKIRKSPTFLRQFCVKLTHNKNNKKYRSFPAETTSFFTKNWP